MALIALAGTLVGALLTFLTAIGAGVTRLVRDSTERYRSARRLHEKYSDPLAFAALALMYRLEELVADDGRDYYLQSREPRTSFETYKAISTLYRLAVLLAWNRALRRELLFLRADKRRPRTHQRALESALDSLSTSLADGHHMEEMRVRAVASHLSLSVSDASLKPAGASVDVLLDRFVHSRGSRRIAQLSKWQQRTAVGVAVTEIARWSNSSPSRLSRGEWRSLVPLLDAREAWIYRDWQAAIGDLLLVNALEGPRAYDVIGYRVFEQLHDTGTDEEKKWIQRLSELLEDVSMSSPPHTDARPDVLRAAYRACGQIVVAVDKLQGGRSPISPEQLKAARDACAHASGAL